MASRAIATEPAVGELTDEAKAVLRGADGVFVALYIMERYWKMLGENSLSDVQRKICREQRVIARFLLDERPELQESGKRLNREAPL